MIVRRIHYTSDFAKAYRLLDRVIQRAVDRKDKIFRLNPYHPSLQTHKLTGELAGLRSFWVTRNYRVLFEFRGEEAIFYDVGTHDIYR